MSLTPAELTILGLVIEKPSHGYELEQVIERRGIREWTDLGFSSIYYLLGRLEKRGLVTAEPSAGPAAGPKARRVFRATGAGVAEARDATLALLSSTRPSFSPFLTALAYRPLVGEREFTAAVRQRRDALAAQIAAVQGARAAQQPLPPHAEAVFDYSLHLMRAEKAWLDQAGKGDDTA
ncbi:helix-turn-helix transcriptional regulator [Catenulispora subtropica]|uniref:PadR family transcriptional regulator n=1 Tax=Catenulispora subtropica TaxID=450798 RepID=A0ABN2T066_9ACTN